MRRLIFGIIFCTLGTPACQAPSCFSPLFQAICRVHRRTRIARVQPITSQLAPVVPLAWQDRPDTPEPANHSEIITSHTTTQASDVPSHPYSRQPTIFGPSSQSASETGLLSIDELEDQIFGITPETRDAYYQAERDFRLANYNQESRSQFIHWHAPLRENTLTRCGICLDDFDADCIRSHEPHPRFLACKHDQEYCRQCLQTTNPKICPSCRKPFKATISPLLVAAAQRHDETLFEKVRENILLLCKSEFDIDATTSRGNTALHIAAACNNYHFIQLTRVCGANLNLQNQDGHTPLHIAALHEHKDALRVLISDTDHTIIDHAGLTARQIILHKKSDLISYFELYDELLAMR